MLNTQEVSQLKNIIEKYQIKILDIFGMTKIDIFKDCDLEVRDWINDPEYTEDENIQWNKNKVLFLFNIGGLYFRVFILKDSIMIDYTGNEFLDEIKQYYPHNGNPGDIMKSTIIGLRLLVGKMRKYQEYHTFSVHITGDNYKMLERDVTVDMINGEY